MVAWVRDTLCGGTLKNQTIPPLPLMLTASVCWHHLTSNCPTLTARATTLCVLSLACVQTLSGQTTIMTFHISMLAEPAPPAPPPQSLPYPYPPTPLPSWGPDPFGYADALYWGTFNLTFSEFWTRRRSFASVLDPNTRAYAAHRRLEGHPESGAAQGNIHVGTATDADTGNYFDNRLAFANVTGDGALGGRGEAQPGAGYGLGNFRPPPYNTVSAGDVSLNVWHDYYWGFLWLNKEATAQSARQSSTSKTSVIA